MATLSPVQPSSIMPSAKNTDYERREPPSPAPTDMSFGTGDDRDKLESQKPQNMRDIGRDTPAAPGLFKKSSKSDFGRKRSMKGAGYYGEVFAVRETGPVVPTSAGVWVELKTNVIVRISQASFLFGSIARCSLCLLLLEPHIIFSVYRYTRSRNLRLT